VSEIGHLAILDAESVLNLQEVVPYVIQGTTLGFDRLELFEPPPVIYLLRFIQSPYRQVVEYIFQQLF
jgi:hypothetical protein